MSLYAETVSRFLDTRDSETWHTRAVEALHLAEKNPLTLRLLELFAYRQRRFTDGRLAVFLGGREIALDNPVMVGAGWDKKGRAVAALHRLGFSGVEVGSVLQYAQPGNEKPRQFMIGPGVCLNSLGFNSPGMEVVAQNLACYQYTGIPVGISLGKNKDVPLSLAAQAHAVVASYMYPHASYFAINVSSPNTPGLRELQDKGPLKDIVRAVQAAMDQQGGQKPLYIKIAPDLTNEAVDDVITVVLDAGVTGIIATNTTNNPDIKAHYGVADKPGGVSGADAAYRNLSTEKIRHIYRVTNGKMEIIGVGGITDAASAWEKIAAGATAIQVVTCIRSVGPTVPGRINRGLVHRMNNDGIQQISEVVGSELKF